jgi:hypothetical protein
MSSAERNHRRSHGEVRSTPNAVKVYTIKRLKKVTRSFKMISRHERRDIPIANSSIKGVRDGTRTRKIPLRNFSDIYVLRGGGRRRIVDRSYADDSRRVRNSSASASDSTRESRAFAKRRDNSASSMARRRAGRGDGKRGEARRKNGKSERKREERGDKGSAIRGG